MGSPYWTEERSGAAGTGGMRLPVKVSGFPLPLEAARFIWSPSTVAVMVWRLTLPSLLVVSLMTVRVPPSRVVEAVGRTLPPPQRRLDESSPSVFSTPSHPARSLGRVSAQLPMKADSADAETVDDRAKLRAMAGRRSDFMWPMGTVHSDGSFRPGGAAHRRRRRRKATPPRNNKATRLGSGTAVIDTLSTRGARPMDETPSRTSADRSGWQVESLGGERDRS